MAEVRDHFAAYCKTHDLLDATLVQGFSANDQYWAGASVLIVADRAAPREAKELAKHLQAVGAKATACATIAEGVATAKALAGKDGVVLCFGSLYSIGEIKNAL